MRKTNKLYLATVGEEKKPVLYGLKAVKDVDKIILIHSKETENIAIEIKNTLDKLGIYETFLVEVNPKNIDEVIDKLISTAKEMSLVGCEFVSNITGATKPMSIGLYIFTSIMNGESIYVFKKGNEEMEISEVPSIKIDVCSLLGSTKKSKTKIKICKALLDGPKTLTELSKILGYSKTSVKFHLEILENNGLVRKNGRHIRITPLGKIAVSICEYQSKLGKFIKNS